MRLNSSLTPSRLPSTDGTCPAGLGKIALFAEGPNGDFHFVRQEADGTWTEKCGFYKDPTHRNAPPDKNPMYKFCKFLCIANQNAKK